MTRLAWMTDIHLNFLGTMQIETWLNTVQRQDFHALLITGDIGEADSVADYLIRMSGRLNVPIYFVLGNHDYYRSSIEQVRAKMRRLDQEHVYLNWLPEHGVVKLNDNTALVGHGAWSDGGYGDFMGSNIVLNDYVLIQELADIDAVHRLMKLRALGQEAAGYIKRILSVALLRFQNIYIALHVPPFREACWYNGYLPDNNDDYLPHFTCKAVGDVLLELAETYPTCNMTVLCGHTHGSGEARPRPNLHVITGGAEYGNPVIADIFSV